MTMTAGSVTVASDETPTGSGMALAIYDADVATLVLPTVPTLGGTTAPYTAERPVQSGDITIVKNARLGLLRDSARRATAYATAIVSYITANAQATVAQNFFAEWGKTPTPNDPGAALVGPSVNVGILIS